MENIKLQNILFLIGIIGFCGCNIKKDYPYEHLQVLDIINKNPEEVVTVLGEPDSAFMQKVVTREFFTQLYYDLDSLEIQYLDSTAKDIVVHKPFPLPFDRKTIVAFGLDFKDPSSRELDEVMRWENYPGFKMVNMYVMRKKDDGEIADYKIFFKVQ